MSRLIKRALLRRGGIAKSQPSKALGYLFEGVFLLPRTPCETATRIAKRRTSVGRVEATRAPEAVPMAQLAGRQLPTSRPVGLAGKAFGQLPAEFCTRAQAAQSS